MQKTWRSHLLVSYALAVLAFLYLPILILALYSFNDSRMNAVWAGFTFKWYAQLFNNRHVAEALALHRIHFHGGVHHSRYDRGARPSQIPL